MPTRIRLKHERLAALLAASRLSQNHWAMRFGISRGHLSDLLKGRHPYVSFRTRQKLLDVLQVPFDDLFEELPIQVEPPPVAPATRPPAPRPPARVSLEICITLLNDLRYAIRVSLRYRLVSAAVIGTLAVGIGFATSVFAVVHAVVLAPLPFADSEQVIRFGMTLRDGRTTTNMAVADLEDIRQGSQTLSDVTAVRLSGVAITGGNNPEHQLIAYVDHGYDEVFRVRPLHGRFFEPHEYVVGAPRAVMLFHSLWRDRFGSDPSIVGRTIELEHQPATVVGVLPPMAYTYPFHGLGLLGPLRPDPNSFHLNRGALWVRGAARVKPGVSLEQASAEIDTITKGIAARFPDAYAGLRFWTESLRAGETRDARSMLVLMTLAVAAVLLIACVNVANVLLGHSQARTREFAVRAALGGRTWRLRWQIFVESVTMSVAGGGIGLLLAPVLTRVFLSLYPGRLPRVDEVVFNWQVVLAGVVLTLVAALITGVPLARRVASLSLSNDLRQGSRGYSAGGRWAGRLLITSQVALSLTLAFASVLLLKTMEATLSADRGFRAESVSTLQVSAPPARYRTAEAIDDYFARVTEGLAALPGVAGVATSSDVPYNGNMSTDVFVMEERGDLGPANPFVRVSVVSPTFWEVMGTPILSGRPFVATDLGTMPKVAIVNAAAVEKFYGGEDPVGRRITFNRETWTIVGVSAAVRMTTAEQPAEPQLYLAATQVTRSARYLVVRSVGAEAPAITDIRRVLAQVDPTIPPIDVATLEERVRLITAPQRFRAVLMTTLGVIALGLSALGIYGVLADTVARRTREIGIRLALGQSHGQVRRQVMVQSLATVGAGVVVGSGLALLAGDALSGVLVGVDGRQLPLLVAVAALLTAIAALASYLPARRASRVNPIVALRQEG